MLLYIFGAIFLIYKANGNPFLAKKYTPIKAKAKSKSKSKSKSKTRHHSLEDIYSLEQKISLLDLRKAKLIKHLKKSSNKKKQKSLIQKIEKEKRSANEELKKIKNKFLKEYKEKKENILKSYHHHYKKYRELQNKNQITDHDFKELLKLSQTIEKEKIQLETTINTLRKIQLKEIYKTLFSLKTKMIDLFKNILLYETELTKTPDYHQYYDLEYNIHQTYAQIRTLENKMTELEKEISTLSISYLHDFDIQVKHYQEQNETLRTQYNDLMNQLTTAPNKNRSAEELKSSQERLDHIMWWIEQELEFLKNPSHIRLKHRPIDQKIMSQTLRHPDPIKPHISLSLVINLYNRHYNQEKLIEIKKVLLQEYERLKKIQNSQTLNRSQIQEVINSQEDIEFLLREIAQQIESSNKNSREYYLQNLYPSSPLQSDPRALMYPYYQQR